MEEYSSHNTDSHNEEESNESKDIPFKRTAEDVLKVYKHIPKYEDPRYTTSMVRSKLLIILRYGNYNIYIIYIYV